MLNIDLSINIFYGGIETEFGKNQAVPIYECIQPMIKALYIKRKLNRLTAKLSKNNTGII